MRRLASTLLPLACVLLIGAERAAACSCAMGDPRRALTRADAAFVGRLIDKRRATPVRPVVTSADPTIYTFAVDEVVKGRLPARIEVWSAAEGESCGLEARRGVRVGILIYRDGRKWTSSLCSQLPPSLLRAAAKPLPAPDGRGPLTLLAGVAMGPARLIGLDAHGRTLAYGNGSGGTLDVAVCAGAERAFEVVQATNRTRLAIRSLPDLARRAEWSVPGATIRPGESVSIVGCEDESARKVLLFAATGDTGRLLLVRDRRLRTIWRTRGTLAARAAGRLFVTGGRLGTAIVALDLGSLRAHRVGRAPAALSSVSVSPDGRYVAGVVSVAGAPLRVAAVDLSTGRTRTADLGQPEGSGELLWLGPQRVVFLPGAGSERRAIVFDPALRELRTFGGWQAGNAVALGGTVYGLGWSRLLAVRADRGPVRRLRTFLSPETLALAAVPTARATSGPALTTPRDCAYAGKR